MRSTLNLASLRRWISWFIHQQPVHLQTWISVSGGGFDSPYSYAFSYSYVGGIADDNQQTFKDTTDFRSGGTVVAKSFVVILPYEEGKPVPKKGQMVILYRLDGTIYARAWVIFSQSYDAGRIGTTTSTIYKHEIHCQLIYGD